MPKQIQVELVEKSHEAPQEPQPEIIKLLQSFQQPQVTQNLLENMQVEEDQLERDPSPDHSGHCGSLQNPNNFEDSEEDDDICNSKPLFQ